ncbi:MAG: GTP-binding protein [Candidatus Heimdallarchaeota archaeon]|nr:MAG: GTP-binding protein [Candidatus Heimdallarchaeota archaeon]
MKQKLVLKLVLLGDPGVGKTSLISQFVHARFRHSYQLTVGLDISSKQVKLNDGRTVTLSINDIGGQARFAAIRHMFFKGAHLAMFVYDVTRTETLTNILDPWYKELMEFCSQPGKARSAIQTILVGNKSDLEDYIMVDEEEGLQLAEKINANEHILASAKENIKVDDAFKTLAQSFFDEVQQ